MALISLSFDGQDEDLAHRLADKLRDLGVTVLTESLADRDRPAIERADGAAARAKASDLVAALAASDSASMGEAQRALRAAAAYNRRIVLGRLDAETELDAAIREAAARRGAAYGASAEQSAVRSVDLFTNDGAADGRDEPGFGGPSYDEARLESFVDQLLRGAELAKKERQARQELDDDEADSMGFPRSPAAMLSRWRLIEPEGDLPALESFLADYADDPYFAIRAAGAIRAVRRRQGRHRGAVGYHVTMATMLAAGVIGFGVQACGSGGCSFSDGVDAFWKSSFFEGEFASVETDGAGDGSTKPDAAALLRRSQAKAAAEASNARKAAADAATARGEVAELKVAIAELRDERNDFRGKYQTLLRESDSGAGAAASAARERADEAEAARDGMERDLKQLESEQKRLRLTLAATRRERDRFEEAARERAGELAKLRDEMKSGASGGAAAKARAAEEQRLAARLRVAEADLRKSRAEVDRLTDALQTASDENKTLTASLRASEIERRAAEAAATDARRLTEQTDRAVETAGARDPVQPVASPPPTRRQAAAIRKAPVKTMTSRQRQRATTALGPNVALKNIQERRSAPIARASAADPAALRRVLRVMREEMRLSPAGRRARAKGQTPFLTPKGVRLVQRCLRSGAGARIATDGVWGRRTTSALLSVQGRQGGRVAGCLRNRLRGG